MKSTASELNDSRPSLFSNETHHNGVSAFLGFFSIESEPGKRISLPLFLVSFAALYVEILLIRWSGTEIRNAEKVNVA